MGEPGIGEEHTRLALRIRELERALATAAIPLEVLYASGNVKPCLSEGLERAIFEAVVTIRRTLLGAGGEHG
jgi:hypothetical protein